MAVGIVGVVVTFGIASADSLGTQVYSSDLHSANSVHSSAEKFSYQHLGCCRGFPLIYFALYLI